MRVIIIHGTGGSPSENWFPWLRRELESRNFEVIQPEFPTLAGQSLENWTKEFDRTAGTLRSSDIVIGHSIGAAFTCRILEKSVEKIEVAVLVAGFARHLGNVDFDPFNRTFLENHFDWSAIKQNAKQFILFSGDDDPYVPLSFGKELAEALNAPLTVVKGGGHLNAQSGYTSFPALITKLEELKILGR